GAEGLADELDHLVGERLRAGDHLAGVEQHAHQVGRRPVQLGRELLDRDAARHHDLALGNGGVGRRELRMLGGTEVFEVAAATLLPSRTLTLRTGPAPPLIATATAGRAARRTAGTTAREAASAAPATRAAARRAGRGAAGA